MKNFTQNLCKWETLFNSKEFEQEYCYFGDDLGCTYTKKETIFRVWAPTAIKISVNLYKEGTGDNLLDTIPMEREEKGLWSVHVKGDLKNKYYTYSVTIGNAKRTSNKDDISVVNCTYVEEDSCVTNEAVDIYAKAVGVNGLRGMVVDLDSTNPDNWIKDKKPEFKSYTDAVIYELHVRDLSMDDNSGIKNKGKFLGIVEENTVNSKGQFTGISHIKELGITHIHLLPIQDYGSIDETGKGERHFNWGYDPVNYNVPEGSYSTNAYDGNVRIKEFKEMVMKMHDNGLRLVLDVVYNHTFDTVNSNFDKIVPNYYHRTHNERFTNGSGCGNETASDRAMFRKFMVDSIKYWINEYHVDGFRFDLMGVHDIDTMNLIKEEVMKIDPSIILYGEGWTGGYSEFDSKRACYKVNTARLNEIAVFNDDIRDAIKGSIMDNRLAGFANGAMFKDNVYLDRELLQNKIRFGVVGAVEHPQVKGEKVDGRRPEEYSMVNTIFWANNPTQNICYVSAHDNWTLWDKIQMTNKELDLETKKSMNKLCAAIVFLSQGIPFIHAGEELLRTKKSDNHPSGFEENSFCLDDEINMIKWEDKYIYKDIFEYYRGLISFRRNHNIFRLTIAKEVRESIRFIDGLVDGVVAYILKNDYSNDDKEFFVVFNGLDERISIALPEDGEWNTYINSDTAGNEIISTVRERAEVEPLSAIVLGR